MSSSSSTTGTLQVAAALAFHLPGARLELSDGNGARCSVGPLTDPRSMLHPAEFRDLLVTNGGAIDTLSVLPGRSFTATPQMSLTLAMPGIRDVGNGLYRVRGDDLTSYAFATALPTCTVDKVLSEMQTELVIDYGSDTAAPHARGDEVIAVTLIQDEGLGVTMVVMCSSDADDAVGEYIARAAVSACLVAEMEHVIRGAI